jgi:hypothetical protein
MINTKLNDANKAVLIAIAVLICLASVCHISNWFWGRREKFNDDACKSTLPSGFKAPVNTKYTQISYWSYPGKELQCNVVGGISDDVKDGAPSVQCGCVSGNVSPCAGTTPTPTFDPYALALLHKFMYNRAGVEVINRELM